MPRGRPKKSETDKKSIKYRLGELTDSQIAIWLIDDTFVVNPKHEQSFIELCKQLHIKPIKNPPFAPIMGR
ncbi:hypothetical protein [Sporolituus thermophilus]|uniref:Uncharacterized protein n=1 Tax=Sporolituus thermophilus DSM 23256 TaxID=1123285 RepID=A0A1G7KYM2_9FIRM|nr:hypothetical protein [Sporolituus thermophilus]SDF41960.1 hypothetical protein SAMN05660235_01509 [Sporolituus thermophilus DSM 23256]